MPRSEHSLELEAWRAENEIPEFEVLPVVEEGEPIPATEIEDEAYDPLYHRDPGFEYDRTDPADTEYEREWADERRQR